jgi:hypothetical protein
MTRRIAKRDRGGAFPAAFLAGLVVVLILAACVVLLSRHSKSSQPVVHSAKLPFGTAEQAYAPNIHFENVKLARATNLLGEEFTYVDVSVKNAGSQSIHGLSITIEFHDPFKQVVLRDTERLIGPADPALGPGQERNLRITMGQIPPEWNHEDPTFRVTGLVLK